MGTNDTSDREQDRHRGEPPCTPEEAERRSLERIGDAQYHLCDPDAPGMVRGTMRNPPFPEPEGKTRPALEGKKLVFGGKRTRP